MAMIVRKRTDGSTTIQGDPPAEHVFSARWIERMIDEGFAEVSVRLRTGQPSDPDTVYTLQGFERDEAEEPSIDPKVNFTAWRAVLADEEE